MTAHNPAALGLTDVQNDVFLIISGRQEIGLLTTVDYVTDDRGFKDRTNTWRIMKILCDKGLIERYSKSFYRLA